MTTNLRHSEADTSPVTIERSDAMDAVAALQALARQNRREAKSRRNGGPAGSPLRAWLRQSADVYEAAAARIQRVTDAAM
jgi:hypothetical protein